MPAFGSDQNLNAEAPGRFKIRDGSIAAVGGDDQHTCFALYRRILFAFTADQAGSASIIERWGHRSRQGSRGTIRTRQLKVAATTAATRAAATHTLKYIIEDKDLVSALLFIVDFAAPKEVQGDGIHYYLEVLTLEDTVVLG